MFLYIFFLCLAASCSNKNEAIIDSNIPIRGEINGREYVDLGLSVLWATENVGVNDTNRYGAFVSFAEIEEKSIYNRETYKYPNDSLGFIEATEYDYAAHCWGEGWRMPTKAELEELQNKCVRVWNDSLKGYYFKGTTGDSLFLSADGYRYDSLLKKAGVEGDYWSATQNIYYPEYAWKLGFLKSWCGMDDVGRYYGYHVRAVADRVVFENK